MKRILIGFTHPETLIASNAIIGEEETTAMLEQTIQETLIAHDLPIETDVEYELPCEEHPRDILFYALVEEEDNDCNSTNN